MPNHTITVPCPHVMDDGAPCEADVVVTLAYDKGEPETRWEPGYPAGWLVEDVAERCAAGHTLRPEEWADLYFGPAKQAAKDYRPAVLTPDDRI